MEGLRTIAMALISALAIGWGGTVFADNCEQLRRQLPVQHDTLRIIALEQIYYCSLDSDDFDYQLRCVNDYIAEAHLQRRHKVEVDALAERAALFYNNDKNDSIFTVVRRDLQTVKSYGEWQTYYEMWSHIANTYVFIRQNNLALHETQAMFDDARQHENAYGMGLAYCIMGTAYANMRNFEQSVVAYEKSISTLQAISPLPPILPEAYTYYGNALNDMKDYVKLEGLTLRWRKFLQQFIEQHRISGQPTAELFTAFYCFACVQADLGQQKLAEAEQMLEEVRQHFSTSDAYQMMKWLFYSAQLRLMQGRYGEALALNSQRLQMLNDNSDEQVSIRVLSQRAEIMQQLKRYEEAAQLYRRIYLINDSANTQDTKGQLNELNTIFQVSEAEMENERLQIEKERDQFRFIIVVVTVIILSLAVFLFFRMRAARKLKLAHAKLQTAYDDLQAANAVIEETTAAKERIESELRIARDIQMSMVPNVFPTYPGLDIHALMTPAKEVGGDLYSALLIDDHLYFCVGDVSGKGVPASLFMAQATRLFRTLAKQRLLPGEIGTRLNEELAEDNEQGMFVTMFIGRINLQTGHLSFCNAGHNPPVLNGVFMEMEPNAPVGLWPGLEYVGEEVADIRRQPLFIYTDGLNEAENAGQEQFGDDHLLDVLRRGPFESARQTVELLRDEVERHRNGAAPNDDLTMMCLIIDGSNN